MNTDPKFIEALDKFYLLKAQYEKSIENQKKKIINNDLLSRKEKRAKLAKVIPLCVNCKKPGGTNFTIEHNYLKASCNAEQPCKLNIELSKGNYKNVRTEYFRYLDSITNLKKLIIDIKLKYLYGTYGEEEALSIFDNYTNDYNKLIQSLDYFQKEYYAIVENDLNISKIKDLEYKLQSELLYMKSEFLDKFKEEGNVQYIKDYIDYLINVINPLNEQLMSLKYSLVKVEYDQNTNIYSLIENIYKPSELYVYNPYQISDNILSNTK
jgi:hypothetical protein